MIKYNLFNFFNKTFKGILSLYTIKNIYIFFNNKNWYWDILVIILGTYTLNHNLEIWLGDDFIPRIIAAFISVTLIYILTILLIRFKISTNLKNPLFFKKLTYRLAIITFFYGIDIYNYILLFFYNTKIPSHILPSHSGETLENIDLNVIEKNIEKLSETMDTIMYRKKLTDFSNKYLNYLNEVSMQNKPTLLTIQHTIEIDSKIAEFRKEYMQILSYHKDYIPNNNQIRSIFKPTSVKNLQSFSNMKDFFDSVNKDIDTLKNQKNCILRLNYESIGQYNFNLNKVKEELKSTIPADSNVSDSKILEVLNKNITQKYDQKTSHILKSIEEELKNLK